jgi:hypothetical protein
MAYGQTANDALQKVSQLLCQVLDDRVSAGEITEQEAAEALKGLAARAAGQSRRSSRKHRSR